MPRDSTILRLDERDDYRLHHCWARRRCRDRPAGAQGPGECSRSHGAPAQKIENARWPIASPCAAVAYALLLLLTCVSAGCPAGEYNASGTCLQCAAGKFSVLSGVTPGVCQDCSAGKYSAIAGANSTDLCQDCSAGKFSAVARDLCVPCAAGKYSQIVGASSAGNCSDCPEHSSSASGSSSKAGCKCNAGSTGSPGVGGDGRCNLCPPGEFKSVNGSDACQQCPAGKFSGSGSGKTVCNVCPAGSISPMKSENQTQCICNAGYQSVGGGNTLCEACAAGKSKAGNGSGTCSPCGFNTYSAAISTTCTQCPDNSAAPRNSTSIMNCTCNNGFRRVGDTCNACAAGKYWQLVHGDAICVLCPPDTYSAAVAATSNASCIPCPPNSSALSGSSNLARCICNVAFTGSNGNCTACIAGTFKSLNGSGACTQCVAGKYSTSVAADSAAVCVNCAEGKYSSSMGANASSYCEQCPRNANSSAGSSLRGNCTCNQGFEGNGAVGCEECASGKFWSQSYNGNATCSNCPAAASSPGGTSWCNCNAGYAARPTDETALEASAVGLSCEKCSAGKRVWETQKDSGFKMTSCKACAAGKFSTTLAVECKDCFKGTYSAKSGASACVDCGRVADTDKAGSKEAGKCKCTKGFQPRNGEEKIWIVLGDGPTQTVGSKITSVKDKLYAFPWNKPSSTQPVLYEGSKHDWSTNSDSPFKELSKTPLTSERKQRFYHGFAGMENDLFIYGGCTALLPGSKAICSETSDDLFRFSLSNVTKWERLTGHGSPPGPRAFHAFTALGSDLFLHGGLRESNDTKGLHAAPFDLAEWNSTASSDLYRFSLTTREWIIMNDTTGQVPLALHGHGLAAIKNELFLFGGYQSLSNTTGNITLSGELLKLDVAVKKWSQILAADGPSARAGHGFAAAGLNLFVHGGIVFQNGEYTTVSDLYQFSTETNLWKQMQPGGQPPVSRFFHALGIANEQLFLHGGLSYEVSSGLTEVDARLIMYGHSMECFEQCKPGQYLDVMPNTMNTICHDCVGGTHSKDYDASTCTKCAPGKFRAEGSNKSSCNQCGPDTYEDWTPQATRNCKPCPTDSMSPPGSTKESHCTTDLQELTIRLKFLKITEQSFSKDKILYCSSIAAVIGVNASRVAISARQKRSQVLEFSKSFVTNITRPQASKAHENLRKNLKTVLAINGLSPAVEILGIMLSCGRGFEPHIVSCRKCNTSSYQDSYKNLSCVACPKHARTELGAVSKENCTCRRGYQGPKGGPCSKIPALSVKNASDMAHAVSGTVIGIVAVNSLFTVGGAAFSSHTQTRRIVFPTHGTFSLMTHVQFLNLVGRIGGPSSSQTLRVFANGFSWANMNFRTNNLDLTDAGLFGSLLNGTHSKIHPFSRRVEEAVECDWTAVGMPLEIITTCSLVLCIVVVLRMMAAGLAGKILEKLPPAFMRFPYLEGLTVVFLFLGFTDATLIGLHYSCSAWMIFCSSVLFLMPASFALFALVWISIHRHDGNISWVEFDPPGFTELASRLKGSDCRLSKYFSLKLWREERAIKGAWNKDSDHSNFWRFLICDYRLHEYAIWMLLKRILFVIVLVFVPATGRITRSEFPGTDPVIAIIILQFIDVMLICILRPSSSRSMDWMNALAGFLLLGAYGCISVPVFMPDEDTRPWYINEFVLVIVSLLPTAVVTVYCLVCLFDKLFDFICRQWDVFGEAERSAINLARAFPAKSSSDDLDNESHRISANFVVGMPRSMARYKLKESEDGEDAKSNQNDERFDEDVFDLNKISECTPQIKIQSQEGILSPAELAVFQGEMPGVTATSPDEEEEQLKAIANEAILLRREKEVARIARANQRLGWSSIHGPENGSLVIASGAEAEPGVIDSRRERRSIL